MPPPKTYTPAALASAITACEARTTASHSPSGTTIAAAGNEIRYFAIALASAIACLVGPAKIRLGVIRDSHRVQMRPQRAHALDEAGVAALLRGAPGQLRRGGQAWPQPVVGVRVGVHQLRPQRRLDAHRGLRSEEHTSELQSRENLVC